MSAATTSPPFALAAEYLASFIAGLFPVWAANGCLATLQRDGSLDLALQALHADDGATALAMLALAQQQASGPHGLAGHDVFELLSVEQARRSAALAVRVATVLTREAMRRPVPRIAWGEPPEGLDLTLVVEPLAPHAPAPCAKTDLFPTPQG
jgi:hypothetical protein